MSTQKRTRVVPNRKWTENEVHHLCQFIRKTPNFEKPFARYYYTRFLAQYPMNVPWTLVRFKVRNLRKKFEKAKEMQRLWEATNAFDKDTMREKLLEICPQFDTFEIVYKGRRKLRDAENPTLSENITDASFDSFDSTIKTEASTYASQESAEEYTLGPSFKINHETISGLDDPLDNHEPINHDIDFTDIIEENSILSPNCNDDTTSMTKMDEILKLRKDQLAFDKRKFVMECKLRAEELAIEREKLTLERDIQQKKLRLEEKRIDNQRELGLLELQMKERIANLRQ